MCVTDILKCTWTEKGLGFASEWRSRRQSHTTKLQPPSTAASYLVSSATSTSVGAVIGAFECPAVGSSVFSSPFVELITCRGGHGRTLHLQTKRTDWHSLMEGTCFVCKLRHQLVVWAWVFKNTNMNCKGKVHPNMKLPPFTTHHFVNVNLVC